MIQGSAAHESRNEPFPREAFLKAKGAKQWLFGSTGIEGNQETTAQKRAKAERAQALRTNKTRWEDFFDFEDLKRWIDEFTKNRMNQEVWPSKLRAPWFMAPGFVPAKATAQDPQGQDPQAQDPQAQDPQAQDPQAQDPQAQDPQAQDPGGQEQGGRCKLYRC